MPDIKSTGKEWVIANGGFSAVDTKTLDDRCAFWLDVADQIPI